MMLLRPDPLACREFVVFVTDYLEGALSRRDRRRVERHLAACEGCTAYLEQMRLAIRATAELPPVPADPEIREHLLRTFRELHQR
jgi:anti-sigma factor RsiW